MSSCWNQEWSWEKVDFKMNLKEELVFYQRCRPRTSVQVQRVRKKQMGNRMACLRKES